MGEATIACCYFIFAIMFACFNILMQDVTHRSQMRYSVVNRYVNMPFQFQPEYPYEGIAVPSELYEWLKQAFVPVTFAEHPQMGKTIGFCTKSYPCLIAQGQCQADSECETGLVCRDHRTVHNGVIANNVYWDKQELLDWCNYLGTPVDLTLDASAIPPQLQNCTANASVLSDVGPCCWNWKANDYITEIVNASSPSEVVRAFAIQGRGNCPISLSPKMDCCMKNSSAPLTHSEIEQIVAGQESSNPRPVYVGNFNRILFVRFSLKRFKKASAHSNPAFSSLTPYALSGGGVSFSPDGDNGDNEDKATRTSFARWHTISYEWKKKGSYNEAGGYVETFYPSAGRNNLYIKLQRLWLDGFFDQRLATLVVDMMFYNGQSHNFMHVAFKFVFHPGGSCEKISEVRFCSMMAGSWEGKYLIGHLLEIGLILFVIFFVVCEIRKAQDIGFGGLPAVVDCTSLLLCFCALLMNYIIRLEPVYRDFEFSSNRESPMSEQAFLDIISLQKLVEVQGRIVAVNLLMIFFRAVVMITSLDQTVGLIVNTLAKSLVNILYFSVMFFFLMLGSVAFAFFTFGSSPRDSGMYSPILTFYVTFAMLMGKQDFEGLHEADPAMAYIFFFAFYILVLFVMLNMFISILLSGYDVVIDKYEKSGEGLFKRICDEVRQDIINKCIAKGRSLFTSFALPCLLGFWNGITYCMRESISTMAAGMSMPTASQLFASCCWCFLNKADPQDEFKREIKWAKELANQGKRKVQRIKADSPTEADKISKMVEDVDDKIREQEKMASEDGTFDPDKFKKLREDLVELDDVVLNTAEKPSYPECCLMVSFMVVFSFMLVLMARGEDTFYLGKSNMDFGKKASWITKKPLRVFEFEEIDSMEHVGEWAEVLIGKVYDELACRVKDGATQPESFADCDPGSHDYAVVQEINNWNMGFLNTTFLRLSIQPGCYIVNDKQRWLHGARHLRSHIMRDSCLTRNCFDAALKEEGECKTHAGVPFDPNMIETVEDSLVPRYYNYSEAGKLGPFQLHGGLAVSFGRTKQSAMEMLIKLKEDGWFSKRSTSMMFDYITYNGNLDMFTHCMFGFTLLASGKVIVETDSQTFSLHVDHAGGSFHSWRVVILVLFVIYSTMVAYFVFTTLWDLRKMRNKGKRLKHRFYYFLFAYYKNLWNRTDTLSLLITLVSLLVFILYLLNNFRTAYKFSIDETGKYQVPLSDADKFDMPAEVHATRYLQDDWYVFHRFEDLGFTYGLYLNLAAINAFFIAVKIVKYANAVQSFKHFASTLADGAEQMLYFSVVILLLLFGWSLFFFFWFGIHVDGLEDLSSAVYRCFSWVLGEFDEDMDGMLRSSLVEALVGFVLFQLMMYFICLNMFLATMLNTYCDTVGRTEVEHEKKRLASEQTHSILEVEYEDKDELKNDINIKKDELGDVWVVSVNDSDDAKAKKHGVTGGGPGYGNLITKVNGDKHDWKDFPTEAEIFEEGINADAGGDNKIHLTFKAPRARDRHWFERYVSCFGSKEDEQEWQGIKPTVKSFWRAHGAITWIQTQAQRNLDPDDVPELEEPEGEEAGKAAEASGVGGSSADERAKKARIKHRLDMLLFSRAVKRRRGTEQTDDVVESEANLNSADDGKFEDELEIDAIRNRIEQEAVTGDEVWLDCLLTAIEHEMEDECYVTEVLRTNDMNDVTKGQAPAKLDSVNNFYRLAFEVLGILECKAKQKWYRYLQEESKERLELLQRQNSILHDYSCELEEGVVDIMHKIHSFKGTKEQMVTQLAGLLDATAYGDRSNPTDRDLRKRPHMERLTIPWQDTVQSTVGRNRQNNSSSQILHSA